MVNYKRSGFYRWIEHFVVKLVVLFVTEDKMQMMQEVQEETRAEEDAALECSCFVLGLAKRRISRGRNSDFH